MENRQRINYKTLSPEQQLQLREQIKVNHKNMYFVKRLRIASALHAVYIGMYLVAYIFGSVCARFIEGLIFVEIFILAGVVIAIISVIYDRRIGCPHCGIGISMYYSTVRNLELCQHCRTNLLYSKELHELEKELIASGVIIEEQDD